MTREPPPLPRAELPIGYRLVDGTPDVGHYRALRERSGLTPKRADQAALAVVGGWTAAHVVSADDDEPVAMGRVIGDGGWYFHIVDMAVLPEHQRRGLGACVLAELLARIGRHAPPGAYVTLMADEPGRPLYERFGFADPSPHTVGMVWYPDPSPTAEREDTASPGEHRGAVPVGTDRAAASASRSWQQDGPPVVPELSVRSLEASLRFWRDLCGFRVRYERLEEGFAHLALGRAQVMLDQIGLGRDWVTAPLEAPLGRGINLEFTVPDTDQLLATLTSAQWPVFLAPEVKWCRTGQSTTGVRQFLVQDPDGYLLRFAQHITPA